MKKVGFVLLVSILFIACNESGKQTDKPDNLKQEKEIVKKVKNFDWLLGKWKRLNEEEGKVTFENWDKITNTEYAGVGFTIQKGDTLQQEIISLIKTNGSFSKRVGNKF